MAQSRAAAGTVWSPASALLWPLRRIAGNVRVTVVLSVFLICGSFAAAAAIQMHNDRLHALSEADAFDSRRAREIALDLTSALDRYAAIGATFATAATSAETSAALSEAGGTALRNIAVLDAHGIPQSDLTGPADFLPLPTATLKAARSGRSVLPLRDGKNLVIAFPEGAHIVAVELEARSLLPSASDEQAVLATLSGEIVAAGSAWHDLPAVEALALRDEDETSRVVPVADGKRLVALHRVADWPLSAGAGSDVEDALGAWYGELPLYFFFIFGPAIAGAGLAVVFVREFERRARTAEAVRTLRTTRPSEARLLVRLADAERRAADAERAQRTFLGHMSHELRTPLNAIIGFSEVIEKGVFGHHGKYSEYAHDIGTAGRDLHAKLGDILDFTDLTANAQTLTALPIEVVETLRTIVDETAEKARARGIRLALTFPVSAEAFGDPQSVRRILGNLVENALKYSKETSTVRLSVRNTDTTVVVTVRDQGLGFAKEELDQASAPFTRFDRSGTETGLGMGLAIARTLAERMGAQLKLASVEGEGTIAELWLPKAHASAELGIARNLPP